MSVDLAARTTQAHSILVEGAKCACIIDPVQIDEAPNWENLASMNNPSESTEVQQNEGIEKQIKRADENEFNLSPLERILRT